jgi:V/A-type H+-transporting ATPase subunit D
MILLRMRRRLELAQRGHRLLKNKQEKLMQNFFTLVKETTELRRKMEEIFMEISGHYLEGRASTDRQSLEDTLELSTKRGKLTYDHKVEMNIRIPVFTFTIPEADPPYKLATTSPELDVAFGKLFEHFGNLIKLVERENLLFHMSEELEKTRRRVNALEYVLIPDLEEVIRSIEDKLSEYERGNQTRLMKVKAMVEQREAGA